MSNVLNKTLLNVQSELSDTRQKQKEIFVDEVNSKYERMVDRKNEQKILESIDLSRSDEKRIERIARESTEYLHQARVGGVFLDDIFDGKIPYFCKNLILLMATTGDGKSTISSNLGYHALAQGQRPLVITNEENVADVYNRITCLFRGWNYENHKTFTDEQIAEFEKMIVKLSKRLVVVDDNYEEKNVTGGQTTTIEGMEALLNSTLKNGNEFDVIIIDYYQNINRSTRFPKWEPWQCQEYIANYLDKFYKKSAAPVVLLAQRKARQKEEGDYKDYIEGRKLIANKATCIVEVKADRSMRRTEFTIKKSRFTDCLGQTLYLGYKRGMYIPYDDEFKKEVLNMNEIKATREMESKIIKQYTVNNKEEDNDKTTKKS